MGGIYFVLDTKKQPPEGGCFASSAHPQESMPKKGLSDQSPPLQSWAPIPLPWLWEGIACGLTSPKTTEDRDSKDSLELCSPTPAWTTKSSLKNSHKLDLSVISPSLHFLICKRTDQKQTIKKPSLGHLRFDCRSTNRHFHKYFLCAGVQGL